MESESTKHDVAHATAQLLYDIQQVGGNLAFGQVYVAVKEALNCYESRMQHLRKRIFPVASDN